MSKTGGGKKEDQNQDDTQYQNPDEIESTENDENVTISVKDLSKMIENEVNKAVSKRNSGQVIPAASIHDSTIIEAPLTGDTNSLLNSKAIKEISAVISKTSLMPDNDVNGANLKSLLQIAKTHIELNAWDEQASYNFIMNLTPPDIANTLVALKETKVPFREAWILLQKSQISNVPTLSLRKELEKVFTHPGLNLGENLRSIINLNYRIGERNNLDSEDERLAAITAATKSDLIRFLYQYYPFQVANIESAYVEAKRESVSAGSNDFHPITTLMILACDSLSNIAPQSSKSTNRIETKNMEGSASSSANGRSKNQISTNKAKPVCYLCNTPGHTLNICRRFKDKRYDKSQKCQMCGGHHLASCFRLRYQGQGSNQSPQPSQGNSYQGKNSNNYSRNGNNSQNQQQRNIPAADQLANQASNASSQEANQRQ